MSDHAARDRAFHAEIATVYDYLTNEPRPWPNELLFGPIDRCIPSVSCLLDLGCGTGQMIGRYGVRAQRIIGVDHRRAMLAEAERKFRSRSGQRLKLIESDVGTFLDNSTGPAVDLVTCVGLLHHLQPRQLKTMLERIRSVLAGGS